MNISTVLGTCLALFIVFVLVFLRMRKPHSKNLARENERVTKKEKAANSTETEANGNGKYTEWLEMNFIFNLLLWIMLIVFFLGIFGLLKSPGMDEIASFASARWFWTLMSLGTLLIIINKNSKTLEKNGLKGALQWTLVGIAAILFVSTTTKGCVTSQYEQKLITQRNVIPQESWIKLILPPGGRSEYIRKKLGTHIVTDGNNHLIHDVYQDGHECLPEKEVCADGDIPFAYITNDLEVENIVYYTQVPKRN